MSPLTATDYAWFVMVGLTLGWLFEVIFSAFANKDINPFVNMAFGIFLCVLCGIIGRLITLSPTLLYAALGTILVLFVYDINCEDIPQQNDPHHKEIIIKGKV